MVLEQQIQDSYQGEQDMASLTENYDRRRLPPNFRLLVLKDKLTNNRPETTVFGAFFAQKNRPEAAMSPQESRAGLYAIFCRINYPKVIR
jgi:hypothetical protein